MTRIQSTLSLKYFLTLMLPVLCMSACENSSDAFIMNQKPLTNDDNGTLRIVVIGDVQEYTAHGKNLVYLQRTMSWIDNLALNDIKVNAVIQVGDVSESNKSKHWTRFKKYTGITCQRYPLIVITGNHDYDWNSDYKIVDRRSTLINKYFNTKETNSYLDHIVWTDKPVNMANLANVEYFEEGHIDNRVIENYIGTERYDYMALEFAPRPEVVDWAENILREHPERHYILLTHDILTRDGEFDKLYYSNASYQFYNPGIESTSGEEIFNRLIKPYDNVAFAICGHNGFSVHAQEMNDHGRLVTVLLFNLQYQEHGGDGYIQYLDVPVDGDEIEVHTYNTITGIYLEGEDFDFTFKYK